MKKIIKQIPMTLFVVIFLGLITINSFAEKAAKKDLKPTKQSSQIVITNK